MKDTHHVNLNTVVDDAIKTDIGDISGLPAAAREKIYEAYMAFYDAYLKIADLKRSSVETDIRKIDAAGFDPDIIEYMQHFFSDYQNIYREFKSTGRCARALLQADQNKYPESYKQQLDALISGQPSATGTAVMDKILNGN